MPARWPDQPVKLQITGGNLLNDQNICLQDVTRRYTRGVDFGIGITYTF